MGFAAAKARHLRLGAFGERVARRVLESKGFGILLTNHRNRGGEIDIIALDGIELCFVEVKTRRSGSWARPAENLSARQRERISRAAEIYMSEIGSPRLPRRFDVVEVLVGRWDVDSVWHWVGVEMGGGRGRRF